MAVQVLECLAVLCWLVCVSSVSCGGAMFCIFCPQHFIKSQKLLLFPYIATQQPRISPTAAECCATFRIHIRIPSPTYLITCSLVTRARPHAGQVQDSVRESACGLRAKSHLFQSTSSLSSSSSSSYSPHMNDFRLNTRPD